MPVAVLLFIVAPACLLSWLYVRDRRQQHCIAFTSTMFMCYAVLSCWSSSCWNLRLYSGELWEVPFAGQNQVRPTVDYQDLG